MKDDRLLGAEIVGGILAIVVLTSLAYIAITEKSLSVGSRSGTHHFSGNRAVWQGLFFIGLTLLVMGYLTRFSRHKVLYWSMLTLTGIGFVGWQLWVGF